MSTRPQPVGSPRRGCVAVAVLYFTPLLLSIAAIAEHLHLSPSSIHRAFAADGQTRVRPRPVPPPAAGRGEHSPGQPGEEQAPEQERNGLLPRSLL